MIADLSEGQGSQAMPSRKEMLDFLDPEKARAVQGISETQSEVREIAKKQKERMAAKKEQPMSRLPEPAPEKPKAVQPKKEMGRFLIPDLNEVILKEAGFDKDADLVVEAFKTDKMLKLPPGATLAQLYQESALDPQARSKAGAMGIAQVVPATLKALENRFGRNLDPFNPMDAILIHREVMRENMAKFKTWEKALKAYNAGWNPQNWGKTKENREYVNRIKSWLNRIVIGKSESKGQQKQKLRDVPINRRPLL